MPTASIVHAQLFFNSSVGTEVDGSSPTLHELCRVMGLPGKPGGISGNEVEKYYCDGHIREIAEYCESDRSPLRGVDRERVNDRRNESCGSIDISEDQPSSCFSSKTHHAIVERGGRDD